MNTALEDSLVRDLVIEFLTTEPEFMTTVEYLQDNLGFDPDDEDFDELADKVHSKAGVIIRKIAQEWQEIN